MSRPRLWQAVVVTALVIPIAVSWTPGSFAAASPTYSPINGQGSTYAALAFQTWTQGAQINDGLNVNYTATGSPAGLSAYAENTATFAGTEAEYSELYPDTPNPNGHVPRGFAYTPDARERSPSCTTCTPRRGQQSTTSISHRSPSPASSCGTSRRGQARQSAATTRAWSFRTSRSPSTCAPANPVRRRSSTTGSSTPTRPSSRAGRGPTISPRS